MTHAAAALALLAALAACAAPEPAAADASSDRLPSFGRASPRMRAPSAERPAWLPTLPADLPRLPAPDFGFRGEVERAAPRASGVVV